MDHLISIIPAWHYCVNVCICRIHHRHEENIYSWWKAVFFGCALSFFCSLPPLSFKAGKVKSPNHLYWKLSKLHAEGAPQHRHYLCGEAVQQCSHVSAVRSEIPMTSTQNVYYFISIQEQHALCSPSTYSICSWWGKKNTFLMENCYMMAFCFKSFCVLMLFDAVPAALRSVRCACLICVHVSGGGNVSAGEWEAAEKNTFPPCQCDL